MNKFKRTRCVITDDENIKSLYAFKNFPTLISCEESKDNSNDVFADIEWGLSSAGHLQLTTLLDPDLIYKNYHNPGTVGEVWKNHHRMFAEFIQEDKIGNVLEIGGATGSLARNFENCDKDFTWTIIEPSSNYDSLNDKIKTINGFFEDYDFDLTVDTIAHSHCLEHAYNPIEFLRKVNSLLEEGGLHYISIPNMKHWLENGFMNTLSFEHTFYIDSNVLKYLLAHTGFELVEERIGEHSVFVKARKSKTLSYEYVDFSYIKDLFNNYVNGIKLDVDNIIQQVGDNKFYLFGAHVFSQILLNQGLDESKVEYILDNNSKKQEKRLYGTNCLIKSPNCLAGIEGPIVVLRAGSYSNEIKENILSINPTTIFV